ncbi:MAG: hypothetical protein JWL89_717 [Candidatus Saccharibacteria bacterium]|jgi:hypothetical protein|nr:hypothetical protein [Candidatus Saccharibacteria bacterium]
MARPEISTKRLAISKSNAQVVIVVGIAAFLSVFCLMAAKAVWGQTRYQAHIISEKEKAHQQLEKNIHAFNDLVSSYKIFDSTSTNVIGGTKAGTADNDGPNSKIILDALPSSYDFPALTSSLEKMFADRSLKATGISGTDDQIAQQANVANASPKAVPIPFSFTINNANYAAVQDLVAATQRSIRPIQIDTLNISGGASDMTVSVTAHTSYQAGKTVNITAKEVK